MTSREQLLAATFVGLADTLVADFDVIDFLHLLATRSVELLAADAAGIMLADDDGLHVMASSTEEARMLELYELQNDEGPCLDCYRTGQPVGRADLQAMHSTWPVFTLRLREFGFHSAYALPMRLRGDTIGALNLFRATPGPLSESALAIGQAMADVATVGLLQERAIAASEQLAIQLQEALTSRITLEQAKGVLAQRIGLSMDGAFQLMRDYARGRGKRLGDVAADIVEGSVDSDLLRTVPRPKPPARPRNHRTER
jgi:transcriptional regulator with GAF, ATPase, and Fis domain